MGLSSTSISAPHARQVPPLPARSAFEEAGTKSPSCCTRRSRQSPASPGKGPVCPTLCPASHSPLCAYWHSKGSEPPRSGVHTLLTLPQGYLHTNTHTPPTSAPPTTTFVQVFHIAIARTSRALRGSSQSLLPATPAPARSAMALGPWYTRPNVHSHLRRSQLQLGEKDDLRDSWGFLFRFVFF